MKVLQGDFDAMHRDEVVREFLRDNNGITLQLSAPYNQSQNGQIERDMQNVLNISRTLMSSGGAPNWFWEYAVKHACLLINYTPTSNKSTNYKTPHELVTGRKPDVSRLVAFYAPGVYHVTKEERSGNNSLTKYKAAPCRYLGVDPDSPANYLIYDVLRKRVITRSTCKFEDNFDKKTIAYYEDQLKITDIDEEFLDINRDEFNNIEDELEKPISERVREEEIRDDDHLLPIQNDDDDSEDGATYWEEPIEDDNSIIPMYNTWRNELDDTEADTDNETTSDKSNICMCIRQDNCPRTIVPKLYV